MCRKNRLVKVLLLLSPLLLAFTGEPTPPKYPAIQEWQGPAWVTGKDGIRHPVKKKLILREKALLETGLNSLVKVALDEKRSVILLSQSVLSLPVISWESGEAPVLLLKSGSLNWLQKLEDKGRYNIALRSDLFEFIAPPGDFIYTIDPKNAYAEVKVLNGSIEFSALNFEESVKVQAGQQSGFQGVLESGEIAYDVLLQGKKIPKGKLLPVKTLESSQADQTAVAERKRQDKLAKQKSNSSDLSKARSAGMICQSPLGKFNQCAWICLNNPSKEKKKCLLANKEVSCVRKRCNANGDWAEEMALDAEKASTICKAQPVVAPCDY
ncbi:hypothetical protein [Bdellovibrio reynosensis]|uniref:FecR protein domain-containing protein n=1 Tax=Bdellovibrio reynosensis TaxID=2835041 RepID=A0ABY4CCN4_9BACT|nr:hypothetical protein [Bdellovibrio reynosensis]UOF02204.1 hypothetical protein MNR06_04480 [Bdellovibrio reynosensis]